MRIIILFLILFLNGFASVVPISTTEGKNSDTRNDTKDTNVLVSKECAAVLLVSGTGLGGGLAYALSGPLLAYLGFTSIGVASGSLASWWQSTIPLLSSGSLFAALQSIAMGGAGAGIVTIGSALGGSAAANHLEEICAIVDDVEPNSTAEKTIAFMIALVQNTDDAKTWATDKAKETIYPFATRVWEDVDDWFRSDNDLSFENVRDWSANTFETVEGWLRDNEDLSSIFADTADKNSKENKSPNAYNYEEWFRDNDIRSSMFAEPRERDPSDAHSFEETTVLVSPECAAVILVSGASVGGSLAYTTVAPFLSNLGLKSTGTTPDSFASWWKSTMLLMVKGELFATLQSIATSRDGGSGKVVVGSVLGGTVAAKKLEKFCAVINAVEPASVSGTIIALVMDLVQKEGRDGWDWSEQSTMDNMNKWFRENDDFSFKSQASEKTGFNGHKSRDTDGNSGGTNVFVSKDCAAVLLVSGAGVGGGYAMVAPLFPYLGFTSLKDTSGSFASWWQSTMPLLSIGSLLKNLQSVATGSTTAGTVTIGDDLGGISAAKSVENFCATIDHVEPNSIPGKIISSIVASLQNVDDASY
mmetsp:Transcript_65278/g.76682  ORF Transcript_65278/g.76682 Transcript_65278/m.76682 type:complete len:587 (-) Transcript_65278:5-1765(-)